MVEPAAYLGPNSELPLPRVSRTGRMMHLLRREWSRTALAVRRLDRQTVFVLLAACLLVVLQDTLGSRRLFRTEWAGLFPPEQRALLEWGWWFSMQGVLGFILPVASLLLIFKRRPSEIGLGLGDWRFGLLVAGIYLPLVVIGTWFLSDGAAFQAKYPHLDEAKIDWTIFFAYEAIFLFYWVGWEYLWRGFVLFGTAPVFGLYAIFVQTVPFAILHVDKPLPEALLSILGGVALGGLVWRCRSFWIAVPIHAAQMMILDFWCALRARSGASGVGSSALLDALSAMGG
jgi:hypothetical protein